MWVKIYLLLLILGSVGCASSQLVVKPVYDEPSGMVGVAANPDSDTLEKNSYNHPIQVEPRIMTEILKRLFLQPGKGLLESSRPAQPLFSSEEISRIGSALLRAFNMAGPRDWVVFASWASSKPSQELEVTSGGMFFLDKNLVILIANYREQVTSEELGINAIHDNPLHPLREMREILLFRPSYYVLDSGTFWTEGGFGPRVTKIILDYQAILDLEG